MSILVENRWLRTVLAALAILAAPLPAFGARLSGTILDQSGEPLSDAVVILTPNEPEATPAVPSETYEIVQQDLAFWPYVSVAAKGQQIAFPNKDKVRHHVYSFSRPNQFELKLYGGDVAHSKTFEHTGIVALGCNIHDDMIAYVVVSDAPFRAVSHPDGSWTFSDLLPGSYTLGIWHPDMKQSKAIQEQSIELLGTENVQETITLEVKRRRSPQGKDKRDRGHY